MHQKKSKKIYIYFFLLIIFGSINNTNLHNFEFPTIKNINVTGLEYIDNQTLKRKLKSQNLGNIFFLNDREIKNIIDTNTLVENYSIFKNYPSSLQIKIKKADFLAKINKNGKNFFIGSNGKLSINDFSNKELPFIFGKLDFDEFLKLRQIIVQSKLSYEQIKSFYFFPSKRWDLELKNNIIIKLSQKHTKKSLDDAILFLNETNLKELKIIDARIKNQIIIND